MWYQNTRKSNWTLAVETGVPQLPFSDLYHIKIVGETDIVLI